MCEKNARKLFGFTAKTRYSYSSEFVAAAHSVLGLGERLQVTGLLPASGAAAAGVRRGDILLAVDGQPMPQGPDAERAAATMLGPIVAARSSVNLSLLRNGANLTLNVPLTRACAFGVELGNSDNVNAYADGRRVLITRGMMNFTQSDQELAYLLAKEMAHNTLAHAHRLKMSATVSGIIDNLIQLHPDMTTMGGSGGIKTYSARAGCQRPRAGAVHGRARRLQRRPGARFLEAAGEPLSRRRWPTAIPRSIPPPAASCRQ